VKQETRYIYNTKYDLVIMRSISSDNRLGRAREVDVLYSEDPYYPLGKAYIPKESWTSLATATGRTDKIHILLRQFKK